MVRIDYWTGGLVLLGFGCWSMDEMESMWIGSGDAGVGVGGVMSVERGGIDVG